MRGFYNPENASDLVKKIFHLHLRKIYLLTFTSALKIQYLLAENTKDKYSLKTQVRDSTKK